MRRKRMCPECGRKFKYMSQHLRTYHEMSDEEAKTISRQNREITFDVVYREISWLKSIFGYKGN